MKIRTISRLLGAVLFVASALIMQGCTEKLDSSEACPLLCPEQSQAITTVTLDAITMDTTVLGSLGAGTESIMPLITRGPNADSVETYIVVRYDSLLRRYRPTTTDTTTQAISFIDSAFVRLRLQLANSKNTSSVTIEVYDVDTVASDTATGAALPHFRPAKLVTSQTYTPTELADTSAVRVDLPNAFVLGKLQSGAKIRLGFRATSAAPVQLRVFSSEANLGPRLSYEYTADQTFSPFTSDPFSIGPLDQLALAQNLGDYTLIVRPSPTGPTTDIVIGGIPGRRGYFRFDIPASIVDSSIVVRATLIITQYPNRTIDEADTLVIYPQFIAAGSAVTDITRAAQITSSIIRLDSLITTPRDTGDKLIEIAPAFAAWKLQTTAQLPRAIVLTSSTEGSTPLQARFFSHEASNSDLRPRLRISYSRRSGTGLP